MASPTCLPTRSTPGTSPWSRWRRPPRQQLQGRLLRAVCSSRAVDLGDAARRLRRPRLRRRPPRKGGSRRLIGDARELNRLRMRRASARRNAFGPTSRGSRCRRPGRRPRRGRVACPASWDGGPSGTSTVLSALKSGPFGDRGEGRHAVGAARLVWRDDVRRRTSVSRGSRPAPRRRRPRSRRKRSRNAERSASAATARPSRGKSAIECTLLLLRSPVLHLSLRPSTAKGRLDPFSVRNSGPRRRGASPSASRRRSTTRHDPVRARVKRPRTQKGGRSRPSCIRAPLTDAGPYPRREAGVPKDARSTRRGRVADPAPAAPRAQQE